MVLGILNAGILQSIWTHVIAVVFHEICCYQHLGSSLLSGSHSLNDLKTSAS